MQEGEVVGDGDLEAYVEVDVEVADRVGAHLGESGPRELPRRGLVRSDGVGVAQGDEDGATNPRGFAAGAVKHDVDRGARRQAIVEVAH